MALRPGESSGLAGRVVPMAHTHHLLLLLSLQGPAWMSGDLALVVSGSASDQPKENQRGSFV